MSLNRPRPYTTLARRYLWQSRWYNLRQDQLAAADGSTLTYTLIEKPPAVWIVPVTTGGEIVLIEQYRYAVDAWCLEVPAGTVEPGQTLEAAAAQELREEIGGTAARLMHVSEFYLMNGIGDGVAHVFLALGVTLGEPQREQTEHITLRRVPVEEALHRARTGGIKAGPSALAILLCEAALRAHLAEQTP